MFRHASDWSIKVTLASDWSILFIRPQYWPQDSITFIYLILHWPFFGQNKVILTEFWLLIGLFFADTQTSTSAALITRRWERRRSVRPTRWLWRPSWTKSNTGFWLVKTLITWREYWPLIGQPWSCDPGECYSQAQQNLTRLKLTTKCRQKIFFSEKFIYRQRRKEPQKFTKINEWRSEPSGSVIIISQNLDKLTEDGADCKMKERKSTNTDFYGCIQSLQKVHPAKRFFKFLIILNAQGQFFSHFFPKTSMKCDSFLSIWVSLCKS